jgi:hypothetical protein
MQWSKKNDTRTNNALQNTTQKTEQHEPRKIWVHWTHYFTLCTIKRMESNEWWHSFMNQRLYQLVLLYKCNCISIISINAYNKNVETIWHDILIDYYMAFFIWYGISTRDAHISPRAKMARGLIWLWYEKCHIITYLPYNGKQRMMTLLYEPKIISACVVV